MNEHDDMTSRTAGFVVAFSLILSGPNVTNVPPDCKHMIPTIHKFQLHLRAARGFGKISQDSLVVYVCDETFDNVAFLAVTARLSPATSSQPIKLYDCDERLISRKRFGDADVIARLKDSESNGQRRERKRSAK